MKFKEIDFEKEKETSSQIHSSDIIYLKKLNCYVLKTSHVPLDGKFYITNMEEIRYYKNGKLHRDNNLPAEIWDDGYMVYFYNGEIHRIDGPALIKEGTFYDWCINGCEIDNETMDNWLKENNISLDWNTWSDLDKFYFALKWSDYNG